MPPATTEKVIIAESPYSHEETLANLKQSIISQNSRLTRTELLEQGLVEAGKENPHQVIMHFCNFRFLFDALAIDPRVGMFLPCCVTVVERVDIGLTGMGYKADCPDDRLCAGWHGTFSATDAATDPVPGVAANSLE